MFKMVSQTKFDSVFDYSSVFKYHSVSPPTRFNRSKYKSAFTYQSISIDTNEASDDFQEENWFSVMLRKAITFMLYMLVIASFPLSFWICVKKVHALERIVLMRLGKLQPIREPGFTFILPLIDMWTRVDLRPQTFTLATNQLLTCDGGIVEVQCCVEYRVCDMVRYVTGVRRQEQSLRELGLCCLTNMVSQKEQDDLESDRDSLCHTLKHELNQVSLKWGLEILGVSLSPVKVLKSAEPVNPLGTIVTALKAATGHHSDSATAVFPFVLEENQPKNIEPSAVPVEDQDGSMMNILKKVLSATEVAKDVKGSFKLDVVGHDTETVYCSFDNGHVSLEDTPRSNSLEPDVSLTMTEDNARVFLDKKLSPLQAYMQGKVAVKGDWTLLRPLAKVLDVPTPLTTEQLS